MSRLFPNKYSGDNERAEHDQYFTPLKPVQVMCHEVYEGIADYIDDYLPTVLDPCAGNGIWGLTWKHMFGSSKLYGIDIDENLEMPVGFDGWQTANFMDAKIANRKFDIIISNPPFNQAEKFLHRSLEVINEWGTIAFLLPLAFMSTIGRYDRIYNLHDMRPTQVIVSSRRIDFTGQGNPHTETAMFIWNREIYLEDTALRWVDWETKEVLPRTTYSLGTALGQMEIKHEE